MKKFMQEFREFAMRGNVLDLAVGVIIGTAFSAIVKSLVDSILMPLISIVIGKVNISDLKLVIAGIPGTPKITLAYGVFLQAVINFVLIAFCVFLMIKAFARLHPQEKKKEEKTVDPSLAVLTEIRDLLKEKTEKETDILDDLE